MSDNIILTETDIPAGTKIIGVEYRICAVLVCQVDEPDVDDEIIYDDTVIVLNREFVEFDKGYTVEDGKFADHMDEIKQKIAGGGALPNVNDILSDTPRLAPELVKHMEDVADTHDEMIQINVPVTVEVEWRSTALVEVPRRALKRAIAAAKTEEGSEAINQLVYSYNPGLDDEVCEEAEETGIQNMSPTVLCAAKSLKDLSGFQAEDSDYLRSIK